MTLSQCLSVISVGGTAWLMVRGGSAKPERTSSALSGGAPRAAGELSARRTHGRNT